MAVLKNTTGQGLYVYAHDTAADAAKTGDAANITAKLSLDGGAYADTNDVNPTEIGRGVYWFALTQAETNAGALALMPVSATADVVLDALLVLTQEAAITYQSGDAYARLGAPAGASVSADIAAIEALVDDIGEAGAGLTAIPTIANVTTVDSTTTIGATGLAAIAAAVWDRLTSTLTAVGSVGALVVAKLGLITSGTVSVSSPVASGKNVTTIQGDDYDAADGRAIEWTVASTATLTGGTVAVIVEGVDTYTGSVVDETTIRLELTAAQTALIPVGPHRYQVIHTQSVALGEDVTTLVDGTWTSARRVSA